MAAGRRTLPEQLAAAQAAQLGEIEIRLRAPDGTTKTLACWGKVTGAQAGEIVQFVEKITEKNR